MSLVIVLLVVLVVATLVTKFYPKPTSPLAKGEILTPDEEELIQEAARAVIPEEAPKPKKRGPKPKAQGAPKTMAAKKPKKKAE